MYFFFVQATPHRTKLVLCTNKAPPPPGFTGMFIHVTITDSSKQTLIDTASARIVE